MRWYVTLAVKCQTKPRETSGLYSIAWDEYIYSVLQFYVQSTWQNTGPSWMENLKQMSFEQQMKLFLTHYLSHKILYIYFFNFWKNRAHHFLMKWTNSCNWHQMLLPFAMLLDKRDQIYLKGFNWKSTKNPPLIIKSGVFYKKLLASVVSLAPKFFFFKEKKMELPLNWNRHLMQLLNWGVSEYLLNYLIARFRCICDLAFSLFWMM